jgi:hypothetical protein
MYRDTLTLFANLAIESMSVSRKPLNSIISELITADSGGPWLPGVFAVGTLNRDIAYLAGEWPEPAQFYSFLLPGQKPTARAQKGVFFAISFPVGLGLSGY